MNWYQYYDLKRSYWMKQWEKANSRMEYNYAVQKHDFYLDLICGGIFEQNK